MQTTEIQLHDECKYQKILKPDLDFSDNVNFWHKRVNAWRAPLNQKKGKVKHMGHCFRNTKSAGILGAKDTNKSEAEEGIAYAKARRNPLQKEAPALRTIQTRTQHLTALGLWLRIRSQFL